MCGCDGAPTMWAQPVREGEADGETGERDGETGERDGDGSSEGLLRTSCSACTQPSVSASDPPDRW